VSGDASLNRLSHSAALVRLVLVSWCLQNKMPTQTVCCAVLPLVSRSANNIGSIQGVWQGCVAAAAAHGHAFPGLGQGAWGRAPTLTTACVPTALLPCRDIGG
jgi:hypothetical protein